MQVVQADVDLVHPPDRGDALDAYRRRGRLEEQAGARAAGDRGDECRHFLGALEVGEHHHVRAGADDRVDLVAGGGVRRVHPGEDLGAGDRGADALQVRERVAADDGVAAPLALRLARDLEVEEDPIHPGADRGARDTPVAGHEHEREVLSVGTRPGSGGQGVRARRIGTSSRSSTERNRGRWDGRMAGSIA